ncbi:MAG: hypothetical protein JW940_10855 [Polyangiaceae bacterium]|nr:hypothetical protein [Polyangiaceae bacterium]
MKPNAAETSAEAELCGPLERGTFPAHLSARVVTPGDRPRVHGYDVEGDLALYYPPSDLVFLSLTGELPTPEVSRAFAIALVFLAPVSVAHASVHAAVLARLCGAAAAASFGVAAIGIAEHARVWVEEHAPLLEWLRSRIGSLPARFRSEGEGDDAAVSRLRAALEPTSLDLHGLQHRPTRDAALVMVLFACGLKRRERLEAALLLARLPTALAEALAERPANLANYPIHLPRFIYHE